jgi:hypothetical protein
MMTACSLKKQREFGSQPVVCVLHHHGRFQVVSHARKCRNINSYSGFLNERGGHIGFMTGSARSIQTLKGWTMNRVVSALSAAAIAVVVGLTSFTPASAVPVSPAREQVTSDVQLAQYRHSDDDQPRWKRRHYDRQDRVGRHNNRYDRDRRDYRRHDRMERRHDRRGYWNGHRGYREHRRGFRRHTDGYYYAPSIFELFLR